MPARTSHSAFFLNSVLTVLGSLFCHIYSRISFTKILLGFFIEMALNLQITIFIVPIHEHDISPHSCRSLIPHKSVL